MNFAIIGTGRIAHEHAKVINTLGHNVDFYNSKTYNIKYIRSNSTDVIVVAVTWTETEKIIEPLIELGIPILIEKPVCLTSKRMKEVIKNHNTDHVMVGYNRRFYPFIEKIKQEIQNNILLSVEVNLPEKLKKYKEQGVQKLDEYSLLYSASHVMDLLLYLMDGKPTILSSVYLPEHDSINALLLSTEKVPIHFQANFNTPEIPRMTFNFQYKIIELRPIEQYYETSSLTRTSFPSTQLAMDSNLGFKPGIYEQMEYFIKKYINKEDIPQIGCTMQEALKVIELSEQLTRRN